MNTEPRNYGLEMQELVGAKCPVSTVVSRDGKLLSASYETDWKEGGTAPVTNKKGEITGYKENYKDKQLTKAQVSKLDKYISENLAA